MKKLALFAVGLSAFFTTAQAQSWKTSDWTATVIVDSGSKDGENALTGKKLEIDDNGNGTLTATFKADGAVETWTFTDTSYTWNDTQIEVTATKIDNGALKVAGLVGKEGVSGSASLYTATTANCKVVSTEGKCELPADITWGFNNVGGKNYFFYGYNKPDGSSRVIVFKQD